MEENTVARRRLLFLFLVLHFLTSMYSTFLDRDSAPQAANLLIRESLER